MVKYREMTADKAAVISPLSKKLTKNGKGAQRRAAPKESQSNRAIALIKLYLNSTLPSYNQLHDKINHLYFLSKPAWGGFSVTCNQKHSNWYTTPDQYPLAIIDGPQITVVWLTIFQLYDDVKETYIQKKLYLKFWMFIFSSLAIWYCLEMLDRAASAAPSQSSITG